LEPESVDFASIKRRQKATWEAGDFGQVARYNIYTAEQFMARLPLKSGLRVLDVACGTGNLAVIAARHGCETQGVDIASNLVVQARARAQREGLVIQYREGDAEQLPYADGNFDAVVSMYGIMFAPQPDLVAAELKRVLKPGGFVALVNWTPTGFIGQMFEIFKTHLPPGPTGVPSPLLWGEEAIVKSRLRRFRKVRTARRVAIMRYPFSPADTVEFFKRYYGPTTRAFESLTIAQQARLRRDLVELQTAHNMVTTPDSTEVHAEYLEVIAQAR
jgi:SAM-dependent methyltransferase